MKHTKPQLADLVKKYQLQTKIVNVSIKKKEQVVNEIMEHTELKRTGIFLKGDKMIHEPEYFKHRKLIDSQETEIAKRIGGARGLLEKYKEDLYFLNFNDPYHIPSREGQVEKKNKDTKKIKKLEDEIKKTKGVLKEAIADYNKFKQF